MKNVLTIVTLLLFTAMMFNLQAGVKEEVLESYFNISEKLSKDSTVKVKKEAKKIKSLIAVSLERGGGEPENIKFTTALNDVNKSIDNLIKAKDIKKMRKAFAVVSKPLVKWALDNKPQGIYVVECTMYEDGRWLSRKKTIENPYWGSKMFRCGSVISVGAKKPVKKAAGCGGCCN